MARRVLIRDRTYNSDVAKLERLVQENWKTFFKEFAEDLEECAEWIEQSAKELVPLDTGKLRDSISVRVSGSRRYPGIIAHASAKDHGFDYALIQEENEDFDHDTEATGRQAHYLSQPFYQSIRDLIEDYGGELDMPDTDYDIDV